jgi:hypothetical protein
MRRPNTSEVFWKRVDKSGDCWLWLGRKNKLGYGQFDVFGTSMYAHRAALMYSSNDFNVSDDVLHSCDNPSCVNPAHLRHGTHQQNMLDKVIRGRQRRGEQCSNSRLTEEQVVMIKTIGRACKEKDIAAAFNVSRGTINSILNGYKWRHVKVGM